MTAQSVPRTLSATPAAPRSAARIGAAIAVLSVTLAGALVLELLSGGVRIVALSPAVAAGSLGALGCVIAWHRPANRVGSLLMITGLGFAIGTLAAGTLDFGTSHPIPTVAAQASFAIVSLSRVLIAAWVLFILWFPDGSFTARFWQHFLERTQHQLQRRAEFVSYAEVEAQPLADFPVVLEVRCILLPAQE